MSEDDLVVQLTPELLDLNSRVKYLEKEVKSLRGMVFLAMKKKKNALP